MFCKNCGKEIDDKAAICVYCGVATGVGNPNDRQEQTRRVNSFGIAGFVLSILSLWLGIYYCLASILGIVLSGIGIAKGKECRFNGLAVAGLIIGIISFAIWGIVWIVVGSALLIS